MCRFGGHEVGTVIWARFCRDAQTLPPQRRDRQRSDDWRSNIAPSTLLRLMTSQDGSSHDSHFRAGHPHDVAAAGQIAAMAMLAQECEGYGVGAPLPHWESRLPRELLGFRSF